MSISETETRMKPEAARPVTARRLPVRLASVIAVVLLWQLAAWLNGDASILPGPLVVLEKMMAEIAKGELFRHLLITLARVVAAFVLAMSIGVLIGLVLGRNKALDEFFDAWVIVLLNLPALVVIVLAYIWIGLTEVAAILAVTINKVPMVVVMIREGARALDPQLDALVKIYRMDRGTAFRHVILPQLAPHVAAAARSGIALIWKIVLVVELLGRSNGVGFKIHLHFQLFDVAMVLVYAVSFVIVMLGIEAFVLQPLERRANRWRHA